MWILLALMARYCKDDIFPCFLQFKPEFGNKEFMINRRKKRGRVGDWRGQYLCAKDTDVSSSNREG